MAARARPPRNTRKRRLDDDDENYMGQIDMDEDDFASRRRSQRKRRRKTRNYEGDADMVYKDGDIVWARLEEFPWWPARCEIEGEDQGYPFHVRVRWFGEDSNQAHLLPRDRIVPFDTSLMNRLQQDIKVEPEDKEEYDMCVAEAEIELQQRQGPLFKQTMSAAPASLRAILPQSSMKLENSKPNGSRSSSHKASSVSSRSHEMDGMGQSDRFHVQFGGSFNKNGDSGMSSINALASVAVSASESAIASLSFDDDKEEDGLVLPEPTVRDWTYMSFAEKKREEKEALELQQQQQALAAQQRQSASVDQDTNVQYLRCPSPTVLDNLSFQNTPNQIPLSWLGQDRFFAKRSGHFSQRSYLKDIAAKSKPIQETASNLDPQNISPSKPMDSFNGQHQPHSAIPVVHDETTGGDDPGETKDSGVDMLTHLTASVITDKQLEQEDDDIVLPDPSDLGDLGFGVDIDMNQTEQQLAQIERSVTESNAQDKKETSDFEEKSEMALPPFIGDPAAGVEDTTGDVELPDFNLMVDLDLGDGDPGVDPNFTVAAEPLPAVLSATVNTDTTG